MILHFVSGLPRSGSTLLCNILAQNPRFHTAGTSGILDVMFGVRNRWDTLIEFQAMPERRSEAAKLRVLRGILNAYFGDVSRPVAFDKSRGWLAYIEMIEYVLSRKVKILVPVRDIRDVLASFEMLWRHSSRKAQIAGESEKYFQFQTLAGRLDYWSQADQPVGLAYNRLRDAFDRGLSDRLFLVEFEHLTRSPRETMAGIYEFLSEDWFEHDFEHVEQVTVENDRVHGFDNLHTIRSRVEPVPPRWPKALGSAVDKYKNLNFWR